MPSHPTSSWRPGALPLLYALALLLAAGPLAAQDTPRDTAVFAGGCFWCMEEALDEVEGVISTTSGFAGGDVANPSYEQVVRGGTGHREAVRAVFDPSRVTYAEILQTFWRNVDPFDEGGQFCDRGFSYTAAVFADGRIQADHAEASKEHVQRLLGRRVVPPVVTGAEFYPAEEDHQDYYRKNPLRYRFYKWSCGREQRLEEVWGNERIERADTISRMQSSTDAAGHHPLDPQTGGRVDHDASEGRLVVGPLGCAESASTS